MITTDDRLGIRGLINKKRRASREEKGLPAFLDLNTAKAVRSFHQTLPGYKPTPLVNLNNLAAALGVKAVYIKDESFRFGQNAFKVLGSSYAMAKLIFESMELSKEPLDFNLLHPEAVRQKLGEVTFTTATSGNHGRGVAWTARQLGQKAVIYLPKGTARRRVEVIEELGSRAVITDLNYDDAVRVAEKAAQENGWHLVQDTAWAGYEKIPRWIMQGYTTIAAEVDEELKNRPLEDPTHLFLQVGVGSFAAAILGYFLHRSEREYPKAIVVEPEAAACMFASSLAGTKEPKEAEGHLESIMSGLACREANPTAWEILRNFAYAFLQGPEFVAARGVRILANPLGDDPSIVAGESGAFATGLLSLLLLEQASGELKGKLSLDENSVILLISTEGDTDPVSYREIVWDGKYPLL